MKSIKGRSEKPITLINSTENEIKTILKNKTKQNKTKQNKTKQNKTKQNKPKQNKTKTKNKKRKET